MRYALGVEEAEEDGTFAKSGRRRDARKSRLHPRCTPFVPRRTRNAQELEEPRANIATIRGAQAQTSGYSGVLEDIDLKHQRSRWRQNVLEIAAKHPSLSRYLGLKAADFPGQETKHFRVLVAEVVADAICAKLLAQNAQQNPEDYENADWDQYYADYSRYMSQFLPIAHKLQCPEGV